jgi:hypothetical protein
VTIVTTLVNVVPDQMMTNVLVVMPEPSGIPTHVKLLVQMDIMETPIPTLVKNVMQLVKHVQVEMLTNA